MTYIKSAVSRNYSEKSINNILDYVSSSNEMKFLENFYSVTLDALNDAKNDVSGRVDSYLLFIYFFVFIKALVDKDKPQVGQGVAGPARIQSTKQGGMNKERVVLKNCSFHFIETRLKRCFLYLPPHPSSSHLHAPFIDPSPAAYIVPE